MPARLCGKKAYPAAPSSPTWPAFTNPTFKNLQRKVILSASGEVLPFTFTAVRTRRQAQGRANGWICCRVWSPTIKIPWSACRRPTQLRLQPKPEKDLGVLPVLRDSPAAAARPIPVEKDEVVVAATDPDNPDNLKEIKHDLKAGTFDYQELSQRVRRAEREEDGRSRFAKGSGQEGETR